MAITPKQWLLDKATFVFILVYYRTTNVDKKRLELLDEPMWVYEFETDGPMFAQATPVGTVIWNAHRTKGLSENAKRLVLRHEKSHRDRKPVFKGFYYGTLLWIAAGALLIVKGLWSATTGDVHGARTMIGAGVLLAAVFMLCFRIDETAADYHALEELGETEFISANLDISDHSHDSLGSKIHRTLFYTNPKNVIALRRSIRSLSS